jgi:hypothetical protein
MRLFAKTDGRSSFFISTGARLLQRSLGGAPSGTRPFDQPDNGAEKRKAKRKRKE